MSVVDLMFADLADLANKINVCLTKSDDYQVTAACHLAEAKRLCGDKRLRGESGVTFKDWVKDNIELSYTQAIRLSKAGDSGNPAKAIADMRKGTAARMAKHRAKVASRDAIPESEPKPESVGRPATDEEPKPKIWVTTACGTPLWETPHTSFEEMHAACDASNKVTQKRNAYLAAVRRHVTDLDDEMQEVMEGLREIAGDRGQLKHS